MHIDLGYALQILPAIMWGAVVTLEVTVAGFSISLGLGLVLAVCQMMKRPIVAIAARSYIEAVRSTPILIQLFVVFYVLPRFGLTMGPILSGMMTLGAHYSTYTAEIYRAGIQGVPRGQWEGAVALNFSPLASWCRIVLPQAIPPMIPAFGSLVIFMLKDSPILMTVGVYELLGTALVEAQASFRYYEPLLMVGAVFIVLSLPAAAGVRWLERHLSA